MEWDRWVKQRDQRRWTKERFIELEAVSFSMFVDNLPKYVSKKELFYLFSWSGMINDIYLSRKMKGGKLHLFAFIRYTTKSSALKAIAEMNHMSLTGRRLFVGKAWNRRDNKTLEDYASPRNVAEKDIVIVNRREIDSAAELVFLECDVGVELECAMELSGSLATNESVCSSEVGMGEVVKEGSHYKQLRSQRKEKEANPMERGPKLDKGERRLGRATENGPGASNDEEDFMSSLKELHEARELERREAKKKEKAHKSRPKKLKL
ncbi:hypothetical protein PIB30_069265 [Stylosanthes scabra]|uniref:RRM domain-containing protein n=1 Tax=Stylosanthes scabra TaxID=79078 RepID=A0ABU6TQG8_9FABA|nr:hypothetical protein [Stylosanthes scabra]